MTQEIKIVLVEDEDVLRENYQELLTLEGYQVISFDNRHDAFDFFQNNNVDIAILDVKLGNDDQEGGFLLCTELRKKWPGMPIIFLSSKSTEHDKISGMRLGADDYLGKDVSMEYLVVRIEALLKRFKFITSNRKNGSVSEPKGHLIIDDQQSIMLWKEQSVHLTLTQFWICKQLAENPGKVQTYNALMKAANLYVEPNTITAHIKTIRARFKELDDAFNCIRNERGTGYRWIEIEV